MSGIVYSRGESLASAMQMAWPWIIMMALGIGSFVWGIFLNWGPLAILVSLLVVLAATNWWVIVQGVRGTSVLQYVSLILFTTLTISLVVFLARTDVSLAGSNAQTSVNAMVPIVDGKPVATLDELHQSHIENKTVFLEKLMDAAELDEGKYILRGVTLRNCNIIGPGFVMPIGTTISGCNSATPETEDVFLERTAMQPLLSGVITFSACALLDCKISLLTLVGSKETISKWGIEHGGWL